MGPWSRLKLTTVAIVVSCMKTAGSSIKVKNTNIAVPGGKRINVNEEEQVTFPSHQ